MGTLGLLTQARSVGPGWGGFWIRITECISSPSPVSLFPDCIKASLASGCLTMSLLRCHQSLPEEEQQRVLGEEKMLGSNRKGATSPASKKSSPETGKVRAAAAEMGQHVPETRSGVAGISGCFGGFIPWFFPCVFPGVGGDSAR